MLVNSWTSFGERNEFQTGGGTLTYTQFRPSWWDEVHPLRWFRLDVYRLLAGGRAQLGSHTCASHDLGASHHTWASQEHLTSTPLGNMLITGRFPGAYKALFCSAEPPTSDSNLSKKIVLVIVLICLYVS